MTDDVFDPSDPSTSVAIAQVGGAAGAIAGKREGSVSGAAAGQAAGAKAGTDAGKTAGAAAGHDSGATAGASAGAAAGEAAGRSAGTAAASTAGQIAGAAAGTTAGAAAGTAAGATSGASAGATAGHDAGTTAGATAGAAAGAAAAIQYPSRTTLAAGTIASGVAALALQGRKNAGDGGQALYRRLASAPTTVMPWHVQSQDGSYWQIAEHGVTPEMFGAIADYGSASPPTDNTAAIQAALDFTTSVSPGGRVRMGAGRYGIAGTIYVRRSNTRWLGVGGDGNHDTATTGPGSGGEWAQPLGTELVWMGADNTDMIVVDTGQSASPGGIEISGLHGTGSVFGGTNKARHFINAFGLQCSRIEDIFYAEGRGFAVQLTARAAPTFAEGSCWKNYLDNITCRHQASPGGALGMDGNGDNNCYDNVVIRVSGEYSTGDLVSIGDADNNSFFNMRGQIVGNNATAAGLRLRANGYGARGNEFYRLVVGKVVAEGTDAGKTRSVTVNGVTSQVPVATQNNRIYAYNPYENGAPAGPILGVGATLDWTSTEEGGAAMRAALTAAQSVVYGQTVKIGFNTAGTEGSANGSYHSNDVRGWLDTTNNRCRPLAPGYYRFDAGVLMTAQSGQGAGSQWILSLHKSATQGAITRYGYFPSVNGATLSAHVSGVFWMDGITDYVEVFLVQQTGANVSVSSDGASTYFHATRL